MNELMNDYTRRLSQTADDRLRELHQLVVDAINEENLLTQQLSESNKLKDGTFGERLADRVASFGGSWKFIIVFGSVLVVWISINSILFFGKPFDPYPFILLNLILSCIAAIQAPVIMMSQNRKEERDRKRAENDYLVNLKAEIEIRNLHQKVNILIEDQYKSLYDSQCRQIELMEELAEKLNQLSTKH
jgi:uncharacterized membrane protein